MEFDVSVVLIVAFVVPYAGTRLWLMVTGREASPRLARLVGLEAPRIPPYRVAIVYATFFTALPLLLVAVVATRPRDPWAPIAVVLSLLVPICWTAILIRWTHPTK